MFPKLCKDQLPFSVIFAKDGKTFEARNKEFSPPVLSESEIINIRKSLRRLLKEWTDLAVGKTMELSF
jgi:hypothetical protein